MPPQIPDSVPPAPVQVVCLAAFGPQDQGVLAEVLVHGGGPALLHACIVFVGGLCWIGLGLAWLCINAWSCWLSWISVGLVVCV